MRQLGNIMPQNYQAVQISLVSSDQVLAWSSGEVKTPETINYRTFKPERDGLFCGRIFGPVKDFECICGKYKRMKHRGIRCEKCGVEVIESKVRRERLGHIKLVCPVSHLWFLKVVPSKLAGYLDVTAKNLEKVIYFNGHLVLESGSSKLNVGDVIDDADYGKYRDMDGFVAMMGAEAVKLLIEKKGPVDVLSEDLRSQIQATKAVTKRIKLTKRLKIVDSFKKSGIDPASMILDVLPVISPELRPLVPLEGGRFATSDLNDLYRRVIHRNNRLKRLIELNGPEIILKNEKRMLQEAVDALFDNSRRAKPILGSNKRPLKSLSDSLTGKTGRFRQNLLGKRVDYSGRTVIVVGPNLKLNQCGIPKIMALELFKPFIFNHLIKNDKASTIKVAKKMIENNDPEIWASLDAVIKEHPVLLNRAPTLHRLGIQAFEPLLIEGKAIQLHPLVCTAFNADFDGDQMAIHVPLSYEAQMEAKVLMMATNNILSTSSGKPIMIPSQDIVLGIYWLGKIFDGRKGEGKTFSSWSDAIRAYEHDVIDMQAKIKVRIEGKIEETSAGRLLIYDAMPKGMPFSTVNRQLKKKDIESLVDSIYRDYGNVETVRVLDLIKNLGFTYSTKSGFTISTSDIAVPETKDAIVKAAHEEVNKIYQQHSDGIISSGERYSKVLDIWTNASDQITKKMMEMVSNEFNDEGGNKSVNPIFAMADSGARGSINQTKQLGGMKGLIAKSSGEIIEIPITANYRHGLNVHENFISTHGARKGLIDTAMRTGFSGYLTRQLVDVAQDVVITIDDCGTDQFIEVTDLVIDNELVEKLTDRILGRVLAADITDPKSKKLVASKNSLVDEKLAKRIVEVGIDAVKVRSIMSCQSEKGLCAMCYGRDLARGKLVSIGEAVGVIAGQSIGEPGTQLTMRTFHTGGIASHKIEDSSCFSAVSGLVDLRRLRIVENRNKQMIAVNQSKAFILNEEGEKIISYLIKPGAILFVKDGQKIAKGDKIAEWDPHVIPIVSELSGSVKITNKKISSRGKSAAMDTISSVNDDITGRETLLVLDNIDSVDAPIINILDKSGKAQKLGNKIHNGYKVPTPGFTIKSVEITVRENTEVKTGDIIAKAVKTSAGNRDITGGLKKVNEFFNIIGGNIGDAGKSGKKGSSVKDNKSRESYCIMAETSGIIEYGEIKNKKRQIIVTSEDGQNISSDLIPESDLLVREGDYVEAGDPLTYGVINPQDLLKIKGVNAAVAYLVNEIQKIYRLQGVKIDDKQFEIIIRQMLQKVQIDEVNDSFYLKGEVVPRSEFKIASDKLAMEGKIPATARPILQGVKKAASSTSSFISNASFETTITSLTESAISGRVDYLRGLKENIVFGRLIPAGTGFYYDHRYGYSNEEEATKAEKGRAPQTLTTE